MQPMDTKEASFRGKMPVSRQTHCRCDTRELTTCPRDLRMSRFNLEIPAPSLNATDSAKLVHFFRYAGRAFCTDYSGNAENSRPFVTWVGLFEVTHLGDQ